MHVFGTSPAQKYEKVTRASTEGVSGKKISSRLAFEGRIKPFAPCIQENAPKVRLSTRSKSLGSYERNTGHAQTKKPNFTKITRSNETPFGRVPSSKVDKSHASERRKIKPFTTCIQQNAAEFAFIFSTRGAGSFER